MGTLTSGLDLKDALDGNLDIRVAPAGSDYSAYLTSAKAKLALDDPLFELVGYTTGPTTVTAGFESYTIELGTKYTGAVDVNRRTKNMISLAGNFGQNNAKTRGLLQDLVPGVGGVGLVPNRSTEITSYVVLFDAQGKTKGTTIRTIVPAGQFTEAVATAWKNGQHAQLPFNFKGTQLPDDDLYHIVELTAA